MEKTISASKTTLTEDKTSGQKEFFTDYNWCLNPILTFKELLTHLSEEIDRFDKRKSIWQQEESKVNLYLFSCAIACTLADYLSKRPWHLTPLAKLFPKARRLVSFAESVLNFPSEAKRYLIYRGLRKWSREWDGVVECLCRFLVLPEENRGSHEAATFGRCVNGLKKIQSIALPNNLLNARMKLNEGFRCQDLTHIDVLTLANRFLETSPNKEMRFVIVGSRTAGSYLAPLLKVYLEHHGFQSVNWIALRPKFGITFLEKKRLRRLLTRNVNVILIDDYSNTGNTFRMLERIVRSFNVPPEAVVILAPVHPVVASRHARSLQNEYETKPEDILSISKETKIVTIRHDDLYLAKLMELRSAETFLKDFMSGDGVDSVSIHDNQEVDRLNKDLWSHYPDSFQVRLKRVYEVTIHRTNGSVETKRILAKSVGLGWLGYHAYLAGEMLSGFVPKIIGLRGGIIFMEWIDGDPLSKGKISDDFLNKMALYLARRTRTLALNEDPRSNRSYLGWGWLEILSILRKVYNNLLGYLKYDYLLNHLKQSLHSKPTLVDGRMCPGEWILRRGAGSAGDPDTESRNRLFKVDFEHHNFGAPELDVVDPAYDLAISSFEFQLTGKEEDKLVSGYSVESGDTETLAERIFLYKLLYATAEAERSLYRIMGQNRKDTFLELNHRIQWSWDFRIFTMNKFSASLMEKPGIEIQRTGIFFMDIDGVFDVEVMGFPHTTMSGLKALSLLRLNGYSVVPNTGRSCLHVRNYCASYGFYGGIGEYGSAIVDMVHDKEISLVDESVMDEISRCRSILEGVDGVFVDSDYRYIVRAFRYTSQGTRGLGVDYAEKLLNEYHLKEIKVITRNADTYFVGKHRNKGKAIEDYKNHIGYSGNSTIAVGDSDEDVPMLENVTYAFAPRNCSGGIRALSKLGKCEIVPVPAQRGLLRVAMKLARTKKGRRLDNIQRGGKGVNLINNYDKDSFQSMMAQLLTIAEYPFYKRIMRLFS